MAYKLEFNEVSHTYASSVGAVEALAGFDLQVADGESVALIGPSGSGKTTALLLATGLLQPTSGSVVVNGDNISRVRPETALILQDYGLLNWKTVSENVALGLRIRKISRAERQARTAAALEQVGLSDCASMYPDELSGGMRQRVALARALTLDADLLLMDEPLSSLDAMLREAMQDTLLALWRKRGYAQVLVTHSIEEAAFLGSRILVMDESPGRVKAEVVNPGMGELTYRSSSEFFTVCQTLRDALSDRVVSGDAGGSDA